MLESSKSEAPGLERDCRQDEYPTRDLGLQDEFPTAYNIAVKNFHNADLPVMPNLTVADLPLSKSASKIQKRVCGLRASTFWLLTTLIVLLVVAGVVAGVLGFKISSKNNGAVNPESTLTLSPSTSTSTTSPASATIQVVDPLAKPKNDCAAVSPQYKITSLDGRVINATFNVSCDTGFYGGDIMSFYSPSLTTCIRGCAMFNYWQTRNANLATLNCSGVAYWPGLNQAGNCWLKPGGYMTVPSREGNATYAELAV